MNIDEFLQPIFNIDSSLKLEDSPETIPEWDSLAQIDIIAAIEDVIGKELNTNEVLQLTSVRNVVDVCKSHGVEISVD